MPRLDGIVESRRSLWEQQEDAAISQANPVSTTEYEVLASQPYGKVNGIYTETTGGTVSALTVRVTVDGIVHTYEFANPVSGTPYFCEVRHAQAKTAQGMNVSQTTGGVIMLPEDSEGKNISVTAAVTWTVQPNPLECRVKYALKR